MDNTNKKTSIVKIQKLKKSKKFQRTRPTTNQKYVWRVLEFPCSSQGTH